MTDLLQKKCIPCEVGSGIEPLDRDRASRLLAEVSGWGLDDNARMLSRTLRFKDFVEAMTFVNRVTALAEDEGHHPDIHISYNVVRFELSTHAIGGLTENDFILAAKINRLSESP
jgi:4a-hydroxytetrahydrobiopterin dehydratase